MRIRTLFRTFAGSFALVLSLFLPATAQNRLPQVIQNDAARVPLANTIDARAKISSVLGPADSGRLLQSLSLRFNMTEAQGAALDQLLAAQQNPSSALFHKWLTPEQFGAQFGLSSADLATVTSWLQSQGFSVTEVGRGRTFVSFSGTVAQVNKAFGLALQNVSLNGEQHIANLSDPTLPAPIAGVVQAVLGLNDFRLKPRSHFRKAQAAAPEFTSSVSGEHFLAPGDVYTIYDVNPLLTQSINGTGIKIAVLGQVAISTADVSAFRSASGLSTSNLPTTTTYGTAPAAPTQNGTNGGPTYDDLDESQLDVEWSGAVAPSASILFVNGQDVFSNSMTGAIDNNIAPIITVSYGGCETQFGSSAEAQFNTLFQQANAQGQTILGPGGDSGATDCDTATTATQGLAVDFPASSPYVTGVGGTSLDEGGGTYWSTTNGPTSGSAVSYIPELPWNESFLTNTSCGGTTNLCGLSSGGGGASVLYAKPAWQIGTGVPNDSSRDVPDLAFAADPDHDGYLFCSQGSCVTGYRDTNQDLNVVGGTSVSTPIFSGVLALLEQKVQSDLGNVNPTIYGLANSTYAGTVFHDVTSGTNASPCQAGTTGCAAGDPDYFAANTLAYPAYAGATGNVPYPAIGYSAHAGYDQTTGWGSLDVGNFVTDWTLVTPAGAATQAAVPSSTTLTTSAASVTAGTAITLTATVSSASTTVSAVPTGTVQLSVDGSAYGSAVTLSNGSAAFPAYSTTGLTAGNHTFTASYSGDTNYAASKGSVVVAVTSTSTASFTLTPATATVTVASGSTANGLQLTVTPVNGFTGSVSFAATSSSPSLSFTPTFSVNPVSISGTTAANTVLTLQAASTKLLKGSGNSARNRAIAPWKMAAPGLAFAGLLLIGLPKKRRRLSLLALLVLISAGTLSVSGCGSGTQTTAASGPVSAVPGTYTITVTASGSNSAGAVLTQTTAVTFIVQ